ncbi:hypothetical protein rsdtw13_11830 [Clostridium sp. TW13]|uniref:Uncharacterized protein n=1 Tax=Inconstantimicrobium mannanitabidum TaxID=1604901 RepID=A0ACB5R9Q9_9CLOT|nr:hypothetical protein rsdtw13_11830 [Clostridium sp. TW13]
MIQLNLNIQLTIVHLIIVKILYFTKSLHHEIILELHSGLYRNVQAMIISNSVYIKCLHSYFNKDAINDRDVPEFLVDI